MITAALDDFLNKITMYRLLVYGLAALGMVSAGMSELGLLPLSLSKMAISFGILVAVCCATNYGLAAIWRAVPNQESWLITALILFFVLPPATSTVRILGVGLTAFIAIASKFLITFQNRHVFNPAAFGMLAVGMLGVLHATWWVGSSSLWIFVAILGLLVVKKMRLLPLLVSYIVPCLLVMAGMILFGNHSAGSFLKTGILASPLLFLGTIMLTEPATMPSRRRWQICFGAMTGLLYALHPQVGGLYVYPETALVLGNLFAWLTNPKCTVDLVLKEVQIMSPRVYNFVFEPSRPLVFQPGQYMEWTLPGVAFDGRGNRRTFSIASSPSEDKVMLGVKFYEPASAYKQKLRALRPGAQISVGQIAGNFLLPADSSQRLLFIAGGVGVTPFRSMLKYINDSGEQRDIVMFYAISDPAELSYRDLFQSISTSSIRIIPILTKADPTGWNGLTGHIDSKVLEKYVKDLSNRVVYISGPNKMVASTKKMLLDLGLKRTQIKTDYFSGY